MDLNELNKIKADAVMEFVNSMIGAYETGFIEDHESNLADVYQCAAAHVEVNYIVNVPAIDKAWGKDVADWCKNGGPSQNSTIDYTEVERPVEPAFENEDPEQWCAVLAWEESRANHYAASCKQLEAEKSEAVEKAVNEFAKAVWSEMLGNYKSIKVMPLSMAKEFLAKNENAPAQGEWL